MRKLIGLGSWILLLLAPAVHATAVLTLAPTDGVVTGAPGDTVGWGFTMTNGAYWVSIDSVAVENESSPVSGTTGGFTSYMDLLGGLSDGVTAPGEIWTLDFLPGSPGTGIGQYVIDPATPVGASDSGAFLIYYDEFSDNPNTCGSCYVDTLQMFDENGDAPAFTINVGNVTTSAPEPKTGVTLFAGLAVTIALRSRHLLHAIRRR